MQLRLILLRHAKSDWATDAQTDHDRPLNKRGRKDAGAVAARIVEEGWQPNWVISSDSARTRETYGLMRKFFDPEPSVTYLKSLYQAGPDALANVLVDIPDGVSPVMAIGHNPGWQEAVHWLCGESIAMTTGNAVLMTVDADSWPDAIGRTGFWSLVKVLRPKEL